LLVHFDHIGTHLVPHCTNLQYLNFISDHVNSI